MSDLSDAGRTAPPLPPGAIPLRHQVAGHVHGKSKRRLGMLERDDEVLKPVEATPIGMREVDFYEGLCRSVKSGTQHALLALSRFIPTYHGLCSYQDVHYLRLQNVCHPFSRPCVIDLKIGRQTWDPSLKPADIQRKRKKYPPCELLGFQIVGFQRYQINNDGSVYIVHHEKRCLRRLSAKELLSALAMFFAYNGQEDGYKPNQDVLLSVVKRLSVLYETVKTQRRYLFYATSLLIVYDAEKGHVSECQRFTSTAPRSRHINGFPLCDQTATDETTEKIGVVDSALPDTRLTPPMVDVRLIDFVHVYPNEDPTKADDNFLFGLRSLIEKLEVILQPGFIPKQLAQLTACLDDDSTTCGLTQL